MTELGFNLFLCNSEENNFKKLIAGRIDVLTALELAAAYHMNQQGKSFSQLERLVKLDSRYDYYIALNINTPDEIISSLQNALEEMKKDGTYEKIKQQYLQ
jgi:polar amino acid transport system substrate-binding protein